MESLIRYLQPDNPIARAIVTVLFAVFFLWCAALVFSWIWIKWQQSQMRRCAEVDVLRRALPDTASREEEAIEDESTESLPVEKAGLAFFKFCEAKSIKEDSLVARHLRAIFQAGLTEGHLEVGELIRHTTTGLLRRNSSLRSVVATFIVFGLLGTLFGLSDSLSLLSPIAPAGSVQSNAELSLGLTHLLSQLKSAFAPSICGISFTILGLILFTAYLQFACAPVRNTLERLTLTVWVPQLFPTTSQRLQETLHISKQQLTENLIAAQEVARFARSIEGEVGDLNQSFKSASEALRLLAQSSGQINTFADKFVEGVNSLTPFQEQLAGLYRQMQVESREFHNSVAKNIEGAELFQKNVQTLLDNQNTQLQEVLTTFRTYEDAYISTRQQIDTRLEEVLSSANRAFINLSERNRELVEAIGEPLRTELKTSLGEIRDTLEVELRVVQEKFGEFDVPIKSAAQTMADTLEIVVKQTNRIVKQLRVEIRSQDEKNREQLQHLGEFNKHIAELLRELPLTRQLQSEHAKVLGDNLSNLAQSFTSFGGSIASFGHNLNLTGEHLQQLRRMEEQNEQIVIALNQFSTGIQSQSGQYQILINKMADVEREVGVLRANVRSSSQEARTAVPGIDLDDRSFERNKRSFQQKDASPSRVSFQSEQRRPSRTAETISGGNDGSSISRASAESLDNETAASREYRTTNTKAEVEDELTPPQQVKAWLRRAASKLPFIGGR